MTSNTDGAAQGEWHKRWNPSLYGGVWVIRDHMETMIGAAIEEWQVDRIIADHRKAQTAAELVQALERIAGLRTALPSEPDYGDWEDAVEYVMARASNEYADIAAAALAQFRATTEEATRP